MITGASSCPPLRAAGGARDVLVNGGRRVWPSARCGTFGDVAQIELLADTLVGDWLTLPDVADRLGLPHSRVRQLLRDRKLIAVQRPDGGLCVPAAFFDGNQIVKGLHGTLTVLVDCGFDETESLRWLFTADDSLPGTPIQAMAEHRGTEVNRRAQALAL
jgi:Rv2175c C-terminal domain of unknown function